MKERLTPDRIVIGTMMFGLRAPFVQVQSIVSRAHQLGILEYDTSPSYINGEAQQLLSHALRGACVDNAVIHSKVGRSYNLNLPKDRCYLSRFHLREALNLIYSCFSSFRMGTIQVHVYESYDQLLAALTFLADQVSAGNRFAGIGLCNLDNNTAEKLWLDFEALHPGKPLTLQRRLAIGLEAEKIPLGFNCWSYGMLNAGAFDSAAKLNPSSRYCSAKDSLDIMGRQHLIESSEIYRNARKLCLESDINFVDFAVAHPLLSGCSKVVIGPTRYHHLDVVERLLDEKYFLRVVDLHQNVFGKMSNP